MPLSIQKAAGWLLALLLVASAGLHAYWALGGTWFLETALNMPLEEIPDWIFPVTWVFVVCMIIGAYLALDRINVLRFGLPSWLIVTALWIFTGFMLGGVILDAINPRIWNRWVFAPIFALLFVLGLLLALPTKRANA